MAQTQAVKLKVNHAVTELGKAVFKKHGQESGPAEIVGPVVNCCARIKKLDTEISGLSKSQPGQWLTPKRIAVAAVLLAAAMLALVARGFFLGSKPEHRAVQGEVAVAASETASSPSRASVSVPAEKDGSKEERALCPHHRNG